MLDDPKKTPVLDYATPDAKPQSIKPLIGKAVIFTLAAWLTGCLPLAAWTAYGYAHYPTADNWLGLLFIILFSLIILASFPILLASWHVMQSRNCYRMLRSWPVAASMGAVYAILLVLIAAACSSQPVWYVLRVPQTVLFALHIGYVVGTGEAAFVLFVALAAVSLIFLSRWLLPIKDRGHN